MAKFNTKATKPAVTSPVQTTGVVGTTHQGGVGFERDAKSELFLLAVSNFVSENTFYETADARDARFEALVQAVTRQDPAWMRNFIPWLRNGANMRTASLVAAVEAAVAMLAAKVPGGRQLINMAMARADEPGVVLAYFVGKHGRKIPKPIKRGIADAVVRLYNERSLLKYDSGGAGFRFGDIIELVHPDPQSPAQGALFKYAIDRRQGHAPAWHELSDLLPTLRARGELSDQSVNDRRALLERPDADRILAKAGMTWEATAGWGQGPMDANTWEAQIPSMGYMALLRNLRNFDEAGVSDEVAQRVAAKLADPGEVARSRQLPFRFLSAFKAAPSLRWGHPLDVALTHSLSNVPVLKGRTLILVDTSGSMGYGMSTQGQTQLWEMAALFGIAVGLRAEAADIVSFSNTSKEFPQVKGESLLRALERFRAGYYYGSGTNTAGAMAQHFNGHDRVLIVTDEQVGFGFGVYAVDARVPATTPIYTWNLAGYRMGHLPSGTGNRHTFGGLSDKAFAVIPLLEAGKDGVWPWDVSTAAS